MLQYKLLPQLPIVVESTKEFMQTERVQQLEQDLENLEASIYSSLDVAKYKFSH